ncbi:MAG: hypothetical protein ABI604_11395 [Nitrospirota bacterium]
MNSIVVRKHSYLSGCLGLLSLACLTLPAVKAQSHAAMPAGMSHEEHMAQMKSHGAMAMGFDQDATTHHFRLTEAGGAIEVNANDASDAVSIGQIKSHLKLIASEFAQGNFEKPLMTHDELPPGASTMQSLKSKITYRFEESKAGGIVRIATKNSLAKNAVHDFLRYQIKEHKTGDPLTVTK